MKKNAWVDKDGNIDIFSVDAKRMVSAYLHNLTISRGGSEDEFRNNILEAVSKMLWEESFSRGEFK